MNFERFGSVSDLKDAFERLLIERFSGYSLDDPSSEQLKHGERPDFACLRGLLIIEIKSLETDQQKRLNQKLEELADSSEIPLFYGARSMESILEHLSNKSEVKRRMFVLLNRTLEGILRKANRQMKNYRASFPRRNSINLCVILNCNLEEYTPDLVIGAIYDKMRGDYPGGPRFEHIDAVMYISEKHYKRLEDEKTGFPVSVFLSVNTERNPWKEGVVDKVVGEWSARRTGNLAFIGEGLQSFDTVEEAPETVSRSELWYLEYRRNPYLKGMDIGNLRRLFHRIFAVIMMNFLKGDWEKPPKENLYSSFRMFTHIIEETNRRNIDLKIFGPKHLSESDKKLVLGGLPREFVEKMRSTTYK